MNVLVTGGAGFIGSHLVERLIKDKHCVTVIDNLLRGNKLPKQALEQITFIAGDVRDTKLVFEAMKNIDVVLIIKVIMKVFYDLKEKHVIVVLENIFVMMDTILKMV